jgi:LmbE family N-acetylglucosaminyl deacetylase/ubiquinone/menaquinone biosynthesis C-methylase UbiE
MLVSIDVDAHLKSEIVKADPWNLRSNPFEQRRYDIMLNLIATAGPFDTALEVGCAAGAFTAQLAGRCGSLHVVDVLPQAIDRARQNIGEASAVTWEVASVADEFAQGREFDLIVVAEVLCYLRDAETLSAGIRRLAARLKKGGMLILGAAVEANTSRWGLFSGAEMAIREFDAVLRRAGKVSCVGTKLGEDALIVTYLRDFQDGRRSRRRPPLQIDDRKLSPDAAVKNVPATSVAVFVAHADDEALGCGGAIMRHCEHGVPVRVIVATQGTFGLDDEDLQANTIQRKVEALKAAQVLGYGRPVFWNYADRSLDYDEALIDRIATEIRDADLVYAPSTHDIHSDHRILGIAVTEAVRRAGGERRIAYYEVGTPLQPNCLLDISDLVERKREAIRCYASQLDKQRYDEQIAGLNRYRTYSLWMPAAAVEAFYVLSVADFERRPLILHTAEFERRLSEALINEDTSRRQLGHMELEVKEAHNMLASMKNSTSWKVTAPLRFVSRIARQLVATAFVR